MLCTLAYVFDDVQGRITWYIMVSEHTHQATSDFFKTHNYFGLDPDDLVMFDQGTAPCFDLTGRILLAFESHVAKSPNGNGGLYSSLRNSGALADMRKRGIACVHVYGVDNVLVKVSPYLFFFSEYGQDNQSISSEFVSDLGVMGLILSTFFQKCRCALV